MNFGTIQVRGRDANELRKNPDFKALETAIYNLIQSVRLKALMLFCDLLAGFVLFELSKYGPIFSTSRQ